MSRRCQLEKMERKYGKNFRNVDWYAYNELQDIRRGWRDDDGDPKVAFI